VFLVQDAGLAFCSSFPNLGSTRGAAGAERRTRGFAFPSLYSGWSPDLYFDVVSGPILGFHKPLAAHVVQQVQSAGLAALLYWVFLLSSGSRGAAGYGVQLIQNAGLAFFAFLFQTLGSTRGAAGAERWASGFAVLFYFSLWHPSCNRLRSSSGAGRWLRVLLFFSKPLAAHVVRQVQSSGLATLPAWIPKWSPDLFLDFLLFLGVVSGPLLGLASGLTILLGGGLRTAIRSIVLVFSSARALLGCGLRTIICFG
jgi:hypothetical protein